jgi:hypothetical protein
MKLTPPSLDIPEKSPFQNDLFGREDFANRLFNLITRLDEGLVMSINASWGEGKTSFVKMWAAFLRQKGAKCIYLDAFAQDYVDDAFITIASEISSLVDAEFEENQTPKTRLKEFKKKASRAGVKLLSWGAKVGVKAATLGAIKETDIEELKEIKKLFAQDGSALISDVIESKLDNHKEDIKTIESFKTELEFLADEIESETNYPLIFIIDELDRCKPTYALDLIEKIKHFFSVKNIIFVLVMNMAQLECSVRCVYGEDIDALTYLQKFINIECQLPKNVDRYTSDQKKYCNYLYSAHQLNTWRDKEDLQDSMATFSEALGLSFRDLEKCYSGLTLYYASITENTLRISTIIAFLVILKIKFPPIYKKIKNNELSYEELISTQELSSIFKSKEKESLIDWFTKCLKFLLITEEEFNSLDEKDEIRDFSRSLFNYRVKREKIITFFCDSLDSFYLAADK